MTTVHHKDTEARSFKPVDLVSHIGSGEEFVVAREQNPPVGMECMAGREEIVWCWDRAGQRIPLFRFTLQLVEGA